MWGSWVNAYPTSLNICRVVFQRAIKVIYTGEPIPSVTETAEDTINHRKGYLM